jgi:glycosyltransferase involved in cell wall biosynthesis
MYRRRFRQHRRNVSICQQFGLTVHHHAYKAHGAQMNYAIGLASHDWVLCMDSDEILDNDVVAAIQALKAGRSLTRLRLASAALLVCAGQAGADDLPHFLAGLPGALFNRQQARFNDRPVDDQVVGHALRQAAGLRAPRYLLFAA